jgi:hypothetical protein
MFACSPLVIVAHVACAVNVCPGSFRRGAEPLPCCKIMARCGPSTKPAEGLPRFQTTRETIPLARLPASFFLLPRSDFPRRARAHVGKGCFGAWRQRYRSWRNRAARNGYRGGLTRRMTGAVEYCNTQLSHRRHAWTTITATDAAGLPLAYRASNRTPSNMPECTSKDGPDRPPGLSLGLPSG